MTEISLEGMSPLSVLESFEYGVYRLRALSEVRTHELPAEVAAELEPELIWRIFEHDVRAAPAARAIADSLQNARLISVDAESVIGKDAVRVVLMDRLGRDATWLSLQVVQDPALLELKEEPGLYKELTTRLGSPAYKEAVEINWALAAKAARQSGLNSGEEIDPKSVLHVPLQLAAVLSRMLRSIWRPTASLPIPAQASADAREVASTTASLAQSA